ncbi:MAG: ATP-binding protein [Patescibacteria group bacterium]
MHNPKDHKNFQEKSVEPLRFDVSGNLIRKFGRESISNKDVAILELLKNSYDAGAAKVEVDFSSVNTKDAMISISDNGNGMDYLDLKSKWMRIATPFKSKKLKNGERTFIGEKGIGRLSVESLGRTATLFSLPKGKDTGYKIVFDWDKYQDEKVLVNDIDNPTSEFKKKKSEHGIRIEIKNLNHDWNIQETQTELLSDVYLLNPLNKQARDFKVAAKFDPPLAVVPKIKKEFLDKAVYTLKTKLVGGSLIRYEFSSAKGKKRDGNRPTDRKLKCGDAVFELHFFYKSPKSFEQAVGKKMVTAELKEIVKLLEHYNGIKLYRDNFRVKPYGDIGNDWLNLDISAHNNSIYPRRDQLIGMVHISRSKNSAIIDTTTREGVVFTEEFQDLIAFVQASIFGIFTDLRSELESHKIKARKKKTAKERKGPLPVPTPTKVPTPPEVLVEIGGKYPENFYDQLQEEINVCYEHNHPNAAFFLCRKMIENLVFNILEKKFPRRVDLWYDTKNKVRHKFGVLIKNLYGERKNFGKPNIENYIDKFNREVGLFRKEANTKAHYVFEYLADKSELKKFKIKDLVQLLIKIHDNI